MFEAHFAQVTMRTPESCASLRKSGKCLTRPFNAQNIAASNLDA